MTDHELPAGAEHQRYRFRKSLPLQLKLHEVLRVLGSTEGQHCLEVGADDGMISYYLRRHGGHWQTVVTGPAAAASVREATGEDALVMQDPALPFKKKVFETVVLFDYLERIQPDAAFVESCHRLLKPDGRLVIHTARIKSWTVLSPLRLMLGLSDEALGRTRPGYTESMLFNILKNGFNVQSMHSYSRFFVELVDAFVRAALRRRRLEGGDAAARTSRIYAVAGPLYRLAYQLDLLLLTTRGHRLVAVAKRRGWRSRAAPVLVDGRSISEAVLSRAAD
ncbi:MAG: methyltransferase domain-containing protein [Lentisphaerae bacterium]|nr:methyltransferase domain-containing protein [Lentisphaerota bacterium]